MPVIARFNGIVIKIYLHQKEHNPPHVHAIYGECAGAFSIENGMQLYGDIPLKVQSLVKEFIEHYRERLLLMWETQQFEVLPPIN